MTSRVFVLQVLGGVHVVETSRVFVLQVLASAHVVVTSRVFVLQVLECVLGARALFDHIMSPGERRVAVRSWHGVCDDEQDKLIQYTVPHTTLCHACPNAKVVYPKSGKDNTCGTEGARRVNK